MPQLERPLPAPVDDEGPGAWSRIGAGLGVAARATYGHTPGHMAFVVNDDALIVGDAIGNGHLALARPEWPSGADQDAEMGIGTRTALLAELADTGMRFVGFHLPAGGMDPLSGRPAEASGDSRRSGAGQRDEPWICGSRCD